MLSAQSISMVLGGLRRSRSLESLRKDLFHIIMNTTEGIHFLSGSTILENKDADKRLLAVLCPQEVFRATEKGIAHLGKLFIQCNKWLPVLEERDSGMYWAVVASSTSQIQGIELPPKMARALAFSLLRARQRWILRQTEPDSSKSIVKAHFIAGVQRLLEHFEAQDKNPAIHLSREDREWKLTEKEIRDASKDHPMGPGKRMSRGRIALSFNSPHKLYPIGQISSTPHLETNQLGMIDSSVEKITPAEAVQALISRHLIEVRRSEKEAAEEENARKRVTQSSSSRGRAAQEEDAASGSSKSNNSLIRRVMPTALTTKFKSSWMRGPSYRHDSSKRSTEPPKRAQAADAPSNATANTPSMKRRFLSEEAGHPAKKQVVAKGKARSVSSPIASPPPLASAGKAKASRSTSLEVSKGSKK